jgi:hypothetical protein
MRPSPLRFVWPALCAVLAVSLVGSTIHWRQELRTANEKRKKQTAKPPFDRRDAAYFRELARLRGYQKKPPLMGEDAARLAAYDRIEINKQLAMERGGEPATFATRAQKFAQSAAVPLAPSMKVTLAAPLTHYRYELTNKSERALPAPVLFKDVPWHSAQALVAKMGFKEIADEVERTVAIWKFVCPRREFGDPPTEGAEEHELMRFLAQYGYGYCDDTARAVTALAEASGLKSRLWELDGHVVSEVMAGGRWRMLDADQQAYFHRAGAPKDILGVDELAADRAAFANMVSFGNTRQYSPQFTECFLSQDNNKTAEIGTSNVRIETVLRGGERMAFTNYNWGRYFLGKFPTLPPRYYNGTFTYTFHPRDLVKASKAIATEPIEGGFRIRNTGSEKATAELVFSYPFPIVGGKIAGVAKMVTAGGQLEVEDPEHRRSLLLWLEDKIHIDLDHFVAVVSSDPTRSYVIRFVLGPRAVLELRDLQVVSDFQFAGMALVPLSAGENEFSAEIPNGVTPGDFELSVSWR